jgi:hypothetical protein
MMDGETTQSAGGYLTQLLQRYGIDWSRLAGDYLILQPNSRYLHLLPREHSCELVSQGIESQGMILMRAKMTHPKLSTAAVRWIGRSATRNLVRLKEREQVAQYMQRQSIIVEPEHLVQVSQYGYVLVFFRQWAIGMGVLRQEAQKVWLDSLYPKGW